MFKQTQWLHAPKKTLLFFGIFTLLHLLSVVFVYKTNADVSPIQDALEYSLLGRNVLAGHGFALSPTPPFIPNLLRTPAYPLFLALAYWFEPSGLLAIIIQQIILLLSGWLLFKIFLHYKKATLGFIFTALFLLEPLQWMLSLQTMSETFFTFLATTVLYLVLTKLDSDKIVRVYFFSGLAGLSMGTAILVRPSGTLWLPGLGMGILAMVTGVWRRKFLATCVFVFITGLVLAPWLVRNYYLIGRPIISSSYDYNIVIGFGTDQEIAELQSGADIFDATGRRGYNLTGERADFYPRLNNLSTTVAKRVGNKKIIATQIKGAGKIWFNSRYDTILDMLKKGAQAGDIGKITRLADDIFWTLLLALCALGALDLSVERALRPLALVAVFIIALNALVTLTISYSRMRVPLQPLIFLLAGFGFYKALFLVNKIRRANGA